VRLPLHKQDSRLIMRSSSYDNPHLGSFHGDDLDAFFGPPSKANADDLALFEAMREYWTSFVTTGQPSAKNGIAWKVHTFHIPFTSKILTELWLART
jgi:carboxylesterase type B